MKKYLMCALIPCAIPMAAFGQVNVSCDACSHVVSVYQGGGGFIATAEEDAEMVSWVSVCGRVTTSGEIEPDDGKVTGLFTMDNGLACDSDESSFQIGPIKDGGWFWITDGMNSAVGNLVAKDILDNEDTTITSAGDGVDMMEGSGAVFLKETATGRVGILPNILPEPPPAPAAICGPRITPNSSPPAYNSQKASSCMLGGGGTKIRVIGTNAIGRPAAVSGMVARRAVGDLTLMVDLWVDESGSYNTGDLDTTPALANRGWVGKGEDNWVGNVGWFAALSGATPGASLAGSGVAIADSDSNGQAELTISPSSTYCPSEGRQTTASVTIMAFPSGATVPPAVLGGGAATTGVGDAETIFPPLATQRALGGAHAATTIQVGCPPPASANQGVELVPDNPFPPTSE